MASPNANCPHGKYIPRIAGNVCPTSAVQYRNADRQMQKPPVNSVPITRPQTQRHRRPRRKRSGRRTSPSPRNPAYTRQGKRNPDHGECGSPSTRSPQGDADPAWPLSSVSGYSRPPVPAPFSSCRFSGLAPSSTGATTQSRHQRSIDQRDGSSLTRWVGPIEAWALASPKLGGSFEGLAEF